MDYTKYILYQYIAIKKITIIVHHVAADAATQGAATFNSWKLDNLKPFNTKKSKYEVHNVEQRRKRIFIVVHMSIQTLADVILTEFDEVACSGENNRKQKQKIK